MPMDSSLIRSNKHVELDKSYFSRVSRSRFVPKKLFFRHFIVAQNVSDVPM
jgi:hypothetical protein